MKTLSELTNLLALVDDDLAPEDLELESLVGEVADKVDSIKWRIDSWLAHAEAIEKEWLEPLTRRKKALEGKAQRLKDYCAFVMARDNAEKLPGSAFTLSLRKREAVECELPATALAALEMPQFCETKMQYQWKKTAIAEALKNGVEVPGAKLRTSTYVQFTASKKDPK